MASRPLVAVPWGDRAPVRHPRAVPSLRWPGPRAVGPPPQLVCTPRALTLLVPLAQVDRPARAAATDWLVHHGVRPDTVAVGLDVERDPFLARVTWVAQDGEGCRRRRWVYAPASPGRWPAAFPGLLLAAGGSTGGPR
ncbi:hypothetical protein [Nocardioides litoris]|uniref:hypothetical protein n=1 Tax=Nocardioides litoris TaxID=1926648 RepID=UPI001124013C|nr:hypothetical protein [Nocardioides litoris]